MIKVVGKTNPFIVTLATDKDAFEIDDFLEIEDEVNKNPICRIIKSENISIETLKVTEKDIYEDIKKHFEESSNIYLAKVKIENYIKKPIRSGANVIEPTFEKIKPFTMKPLLEDSFVIGEVNGTSMFMNFAPQEYKDLFLVRRNNTLQNQTSIPFLLDYKKMSESPHIGLFGGSGSGKTFALKVITEEIMKRQIPLIVFDPHIEMNFNKTRKNIPDKMKIDFNNHHKIFTIGKNLGIDFCEINTEELMTIMEFAGEMSGAMTNLMRAIHNTGDSFVLLKSKIKKLIELFERNEQHRLSKNELTKEEWSLWETHSSNIPGTGTLIAISWRLNALEQEGVFECGIEEIKSAIQQQKTCVIRGEMKALNIVGSYLISKIYHLRKKYVDGKDYGFNEEGFVPFIVALDEAHIFCPKSTTKSPIKSILKTIAQEGRKYGIFEIMATQRPSLLDETIVAQMSTKFIFKLSIKEDLTSIEKETDLSKEEIERLPYISSGECFVSSSIFGKTMSVLVRYNTTEDKNKLNPFDELNTRQTNPIQDYLLTILPINNINMAQKIELLQNKFNKRFMASDIISEMEHLASLNKVRKDKTPMGISYLI